MKKWIPNEMLTDEPMNDAESNDFQDILFQRKDEHVIKDPALNGKEMEIISDVVAKEDGTYAMRFSVEAGTEFYFDNFDDKYIEEKTYNIDIPLDVVGDPNDQNGHQIIFDLDKGVEIYERTKTYDADQMGEKKDLIKNETDDLPLPYQKGFKEYAEKLENSINKVGFDVFETNIVKEVEEPKQDKKEKKGFSPSI